MFSGMESTRCCCLFEDDRSNDVLLRYNIQFYDRGAILSGGRQRGQDLSNKKFGRLMVDGI